MRKILESAPDMFPKLSINEADDGVTAIEEVKKQRDLGIEFDFILIDFVMVSVLILPVCSQLIDMHLQITMNGPVAINILRESMGYKGVVVGRA